MALLATNVLRLSGGMLVRALRDHPGYDVRSPADGAPDADVDEQTRSALALLTPLTILIA